MSDDLIRRSDAIDAIMETCCYCSETKVLTEIRNLPTIEPKRGEVMTKEIHDINARALDFVVELIEYIFEYPDDDYMTMECLCRKLVKYKLMRKIEGYYIADRKTEPQTEVRYSDSTDYQGAVDYVTDTDCSWK